MAFPLTEEQKRIVDDRGGELLVSAAGQGISSLSDRTRWCWAAVWSI